MKRERSIGAHFSFAVRKGKLLSKKSLAISANFGLSETIVRWNGIYFN
ncbi:MAG: hypothetical protein L6420_07590 [Elusimicrobia bacterium]|nr:hypothetical protein [Elusimicrobiota bacterium]